MAAITATVAPSRPAGRLFFVDNLRVFLTILVVLHHTLITYTHAGSWLYIEGQPDFITNAVGAWLTATDHAFFMGLFLLISAYFVPGAYDRKGPGRFVKDRLIRLGIPLAIFSWLVFPTLVYVYLRVTEGLAAGWWQFYTDYYRQGGAWLGGGPAWFISALLLFSLAYAGVRLLARRRVPRPATTATEVGARFPSGRATVLFALGLGVVAFVIRLWSPCDLTFSPLNFQLADFGQYIALFVVGLLAYRRNWLLSLPDATGRRWLIAGALLIVAWWPMVLFSGAVQDVEPFKGGWHWQALVNAVYQSFICISLCISLVYLFRRRLDGQGQAARFLSRNAYVTYLIHAPVLVALGLALSGVAVYPLLKFVLVGALALVVCFGLGSLIRRLPYADRVL